MSEKAGTTQTDATSTLYHRENGFSFAEQRPYKGGWIVGKFETFSNGRGLAYDEYTYIGGKRNPTVFATREEAEAEAVKF